MPTKAGKPNILILWGDDIGWWNISYNNRGQMGYRTPNIDRIGNEGMTFTDYYGQQSCTAGRAAFITGQNPIRTGLTKVGMPGADVGIRAEDPTIAELLKPLGYATGQFGKNHLGDKDEFLPTVHGLRAWAGQMVAKLVGGQIVADTVDSQYVVLTTLITPEELEDDDSLSACPAIYQRRVEKQYEIRVTVVGDEVFACRIDSQALKLSQVDWRAVGPSALDCKPYELDNAVADRCRALLRQLGLETAGLDLIVTPAGETVFLEANAAGAWAWVEQATGLPIAAAVARRLSSGVRA